MTKLIHLEGPKGQKHETADPREANDLIMLHGWKHAPEPKPEDTGNTGGKGDEKADQKPANKSAQKPANKAK